MNRVYVILDMDTDMIISVCKTMATAMQYVFNTLTDCGYAKFIVEPIRDDCWEVTFPSKDFICATHYIITREEVEE